MHVTFVDDEFIRLQNQKFRKHNHVTDVLSFPSLHPQKSRRAYKNQFLGDVLISLDQAQRQAVWQKIDVKHEILFLILHSLLHLIGFDHDHPEATYKMQRLESWLWKNLV